MNTDVDDEVYDEDMMEGVYDSIIGKEEERKRPGGAEFRLGRRGMMRNNQTPLPPQLPYIDPFINEEYDLGTIHEEEESDEEKTRKSKSRHSESSVHTSRIKQSVAQLEEESYYDEEGLSGLLNEDEEIDIEIFGNGVPSKKERRARMVEEERRRREEERCEEEELMRSLDR